MQTGVVLAISAVVSITIYFIVTVFYKKIRARFGKNKYKLPDEIPLFAELENIPDKSNFIQNCRLLENSVILKEAAQEETSVDMLMTDESVLQNGFSLSGENLILKCDSPHTTTWNEICELPVIIGKSNKCDVVIANDNMLNDMHGILFARDGKHFYLDMNSISGSVVDGALASSAMELKNGSHIQICQTTIHFIIQSHISSS